jgi:TonB family protein
MSEGLHTNRLFNESGCLSIETLKGYKDIRLPEDEMKIVEAHISGCPLCKDALEGVHLFRDSSYDLDARTTHINRKLRQRFGYFPGRKRAAARSPKLRVFLIPAAASIIIMFGIISYFHYFLPENNDLAMVLSTDTSEVNREKDAVTIGGIMKDDDKGVPAASAESPVEKQVVIEEKPDVIEDVTMPVMEDVAGAGVEKAEAFNVSRAKSGKKDMSEEPPMFPGGPDSLNSFLEKNIIYPLVFDGSGDTSVIVQFTINKKGKIEDVSIIQSAGEEYDNEVLRVLKLMPDWVPGVSDGHNESMKHTLSISVPLQP